MIQMQKSFSIIEFEPQYQQQVIEVIGSNLTRLKVISQSEAPLQDEDLSQIPQIYKGRGRFWIAVKNGKVLGTVAILDLGNNIAKLKRMFVLNNYQGKGIGPALLAHAVSFAKTQGFKEIILNTHFLMKRAHHFYEKYGFQRIGRQREKYQYLLTL